MGRIARTTGVVCAALASLLVGCGGGTGDPDGAAPRGSTPGASEAAATVGRSAPSTTVVEPIVGAHPPGPGAPSADEVGMGVRGVLRDQHGTQDRDDDTPVPGVRIYVTSDGGPVVGEAVSDTEGRWGVPIAASGEYAVSLEEDDMPEGAADPGTGTLDVFVEPDQVRVLLFTVRRPS